MPFAWLQSSIPEAVTATFSAKRHAMLQREVKERAALLMRLGHSRQEAAARCRANVAWEYELEPDLPAVAGEIDALVAEVRDRAKIA